MSCLANILWFVFGGFWMGLGWSLAGILWCVTIIGIPFGVQLFKLGTYALWPFGHELVFRPTEPGCLSTAMNLIWIILGFWEVAILHLVFGLLCCITIVGIPWGYQHFKMALNALFPFGKEIR